MLKFNNTYQNHPYKTRLLDTEIYARRKSTKGMSQYALAEKIGVSRNCIYLLECHAHIPKIETIYDIMIALGFSAEERGAFLENTWMHAIRTKRSNKSMKKNWRVLYDGYL